jgi:hypothetical protein
MVNYEFLKGLDQDMFYSMVRRGIIPVHIMDWITVYEYFLNELKTNPKTVSIVATADHYNCTDKTIYNIIRFMKN